MLPMIPKPLLGALITLVTLAVVGIVGAHYTAFSALEARVAVIEVDRARALAIFERTNRDLHELQERTAEILNRVTRIEAKLDRR